MLEIKNLRNDRQWRAATGYSQEQFGKLLVHFEKAYIDHHGKDLLTKIEDSPNPQHIKTYEGQMLLTLFYLKTGVSFDVLGVLFGMDGSNAKRNCEKGLLVLEKTLDNLGLLPKRGFKTIKEFEAHMAGNEKLLIDATEVRTERPSNNEEQKENYSGKKNAIQ